MNREREMEKGLTVELQGTGREGVRRYERPRPGISRPVWPMNAWYCVRDYAVSYRHSESGAGAQLMAG